MSVKGLADAGVSDRAARLVPKGIRLGVIPNDFGRQVRLGSYIDGVASVVTDPLDTAAGSQRLLRLLDAPHRNVNLPDRSVLGTAALLDGDSASGWQHIRARHVLGTDASGTGRLTLFPSELSESQILEMIEEATERGIDDVDDSFARVHNFGGRYGVDNLRVVFAADGRIISAYPLDGPGVIVVRP